MDAGCGPGLTTKLLSYHSNIDSIIYSFDYSTDMVSLCKKEFESYVEFNSNNKNFWEVCDLRNKDNLNIIDDTKDLRNLYSGKIVKFFEGNIENLPFQSCQFDLYVSSLCIMLCEDADKAINEAFRVTKNGGASIFSIWGDKTKSKYFFELFKKVFDKYNISLGIQRSNYYLADDIPELKEKFKRAGFKKVLMEYTNVIFDCYTADDYVSKFKTPSVIKILNTLNDCELEKIILDDVKKLAQEEIIDKNEFPVLNCMIIVAIKD